MIDSAVWNTRATPFKGKRKGRRVGRRRGNRKREKEKEREREDKREAVLAMADRRGSFNVATPVITSALTGDDSPSLFRGFTGSSNARESSRETDARQGKSAASLWGTNVVQS